jgi:TonB family protein
MKKKLISAFLGCSVLAAALGTSAVEPPAPYRTKLPAVNAADYGNTAFADLYVETNAYGYVTHAEVKATSHPELGEACVEAIRQWRYSPARENGQPVAAKFIQPIHFNDGLITTAVAKPASRQAKATHREAPALPDALKHITGSIVVAVQLDDKGQITSVAIDSATHEELAPYCEGAVRQWKFEPALTDGQAVPATVHVPFRFIGDPLEPAGVSKASTPEDRELSPLRQPWPRLPEALATAAGEAEIAFVVDPSGYVSQPEIKSSTHAQLAEIARQTVLNWKYRPAVKDGQPVAVKVLQPFRFNGGVILTESRAKVDKLPAARLTPQPDLPEALRHIPGYVTVLFGLDAGANVLSVETKDASLSELELPTLAAARNWKFRPALKDGLPTASKVSVSFLFK